MAMSQETTNSAPLNYSCNDQIRKISHDKSVAAISSSSVNSHSSNDSSLANAPSVEQHRADAQPDALQQTRTTSSTEPLFSVFTPNQKRFIIFIASWAGLFSPVSLSIYLPALNVISRDLNVSNTLINLTLTSYMIFQGLAPAFIGNLADTRGRRPAYLVCFIIYIAANIGLATQNSYAALFVLRCLQSTGSSATIAMASAVVADVATPAERGRCMGFTVAGTLIGPALGGVVGGVLTQFLGWRAVFWFLAIFAGVFLVIFGVFLPETARTVVGNGSVPPKGMNMSLMNFLAARKARREATGQNQNLDEHKHLLKPKSGFMNPLSALKIIFDKSNAILLFYNAFLFAAFYDVTATIPSQFANIYGFNDIQIGLCYIPSGVGALCAVLLSGRLLDQHFKRWCTKLGVTVKKGRNQDLNDFPIEKVRLQIALPSVYISICCLLIFGWVLHFHGPVAVLLVILFFTTLSLTVAFNVISTLLIDVYPKRPATAAAANNLVRCLLGAGATGLVIPMINGMGIGWTYTLLSFFLLGMSPMLWVLVWRGMTWREARLVKEMEKDRKRNENTAGNTEEGGVSEKTLGEKSDDAASKKGTIAGEVIEVPATIDGEREGGR